MKQVNQVVSPSKLNLLVLHPIPNSLNKAWAHASLHSNQLVSLMIQRLSRDKHHSQLKLGTKVLVTRSKKMKKEVWVIKFPLKIKEGRVSINLQLFNLKIASRTEVKVGLLNLIVANKLVTLITQSSLHLNRKLIPLSSLEPAQPLQNNWLSLLSKSNKMEDLEEEPKFLKLNYHVKISLLTLIHRTNHSTLVSLLSAMDREPERPAILVK